MDNCCCSVNAKWNTIPKYKIWDLREQYLCASDVHEDSEVGEVVTVADGVAGGVRGHPAPVRAPRPR